ncbi:GNAT family N-acetyltransferase [Agrilactobacillus yilanensis]|uniref:GNAT family N-acetyltransferase n=1 Tax=Agrilactobacillus yilanensis TaxID=2485997 RepID=A0ABW4J5X0_9LACO|nr:GNAT family N-acetyltransferase [Agrilactobacillus yilanensis]
MAEIKKCTLADLDTLQAVSIQTYKETFDGITKDENMVTYLEEAYNKPKLTRELQNELSEFYFLYVQQQLAGYFKVNIEDAQSEPMGPDSFEVERIYVRPAFKRQGLGRQMLTLATELAQQRHKKEMWLGVWEHNYKAQAFYKTMGFERFSEHHFIMGDDVQTDFLLKKVLPEA